MPIEVGHKERSIFLHRKPMGSMCVSQPESKVPTWNPMDKPKVMLGARGGIYPMTPSLTERLTGMKKVGV